MGMTEQEAIVKIKDQKRLCLQTGYIKVQGITEALDIGIKALEKQIAKNPVKRSFIVPYEGINVCPSCKEPLPSSKEHHCKCGQKLDWSDKDENI